MGSWPAVVLLGGALASLLAGATTSQPALDEDDDLLPSFAFEEENQTDAGKYRSGSAAPFYRSRKVTPRLAQTPWGAPSIASAPLLPRMPY